MMFVEAMKLFLLILSSVIVFESKGVYLIFELFMNFENEVAGLLIVKTSIYFDLLKFC